MSDYSRRNRRPSSSNDDFDWESFDRETASYSTLSESDSEMLRRRRSSSDKQAPKRRRTAERQPVSEKETYNRENRYATQQSRPVSKRKKRYKKKLTEKQIIFRHRLRMSILIVVLICVVVLSGMFVGMYAAVSREVSELNIKNLALNETSCIYYYDDNGNAKLLTELHSTSKSIWVEPNEIASCFKDAIVSIEDERYYEHHGVDFKRTAGATAGYILSKITGKSATYGGSTITQQTIKNITAEKDQTATRKIKEIMRAFAFERQLSKEEILGLYCNVAHFANGCDGVEAAARTYFNKSASELNLQEAASIAGITQYPDKYDPIKNPKNNVEKRNIVLAKMYELGKISKQEYDTAKNSELKLDLTYQKEQSQMTSYFEDQLVNDVIDDLVTKKNYARDFAKSQVYNGGYKIYATIDPKIQSAMTNVFETRSNFPAAIDDKVLQAGMVVTDPHTGQIKGIIGGLGQKKDIQGFNRATQSYRQPGSSIKPLAVYAPAVDMGKITESDIVKDEKITIDKWTPKNAYSGFKGNMTVKEAVARSANIPAVKVLEQVGVSNSYGYLENKFHISSLLDEDKNYASLGLGGLQKGVNVKEMASAYGVFANSGKYVMPHTYVKVLDSNNTVILSNEYKETQAISESAAYITSSLLWGPVNLSCGTAYGNSLSNGMPTYGKTGTTDSNFDKWFVGYTPYYVGAVWFGFDTPSDLSKSGIRSNPALTAWKLVFEKISEGQSYETLTKPSNVKEVQICLTSGNVASNICQRVTAYYVQGTEPTKRCTGHGNITETIDDGEDEEDGETDSTVKPSHTVSPSETPKTTATAKPTQTQAPSTPKPVTTPPPAVPTEQPQTPPQAPNTIESE